MRFSAAQITDLLGADKVVPLVHLHLGLIVATRQGSRVDKT